MNTIKFSPLLFGATETPFGSIPGTTKAETSYTASQLCKYRTRGVLKLNRFCKTIELAEQLRGKCKIKFYISCSGTWNMSVFVGGELYAQVYLDAKTNFRIYMGDQSNPENCHWSRALLFLYMYLLLISEGCFEQTTKVFSEILGRMDKGIPPLPMDAILLSDTFYFETKHALGGNLSDYAVTILDMAAIPTTGPWDPYLGTNAFLKRMSDDSKEKKKPKAVSSSLLEDCMAGKYVVEHDWDDEAKSLIQPLSSMSSLVVTPEFERALKLIRRSLTNPDARPFQGLFYGNPSTGKSFISRMLGTALGLPVYAIPMKPHSEEDTFEGMTKVHEGKWDFVATPFLKAFKNGGLVILEEFNLAEPGVLQGALSQALEEPYMLLEDGITPVHRHPLCCVIGTMNPEVAGSKTQNDAFLSRLRHQFEIKEASKESILQQISAEYPEADTKAIEAVYSEYRKAVDFLAQNGGHEYDMKLTMRHVYACIERILEGEMWGDVTVDVFSSAIRLGGDTEMAQLLADALKGIR